MEVNDGPAELQQEQSRKRKDCSLSRVTEKGPNLWLSEAMALEVLVGFLLIGIQPWVQ